jgi:hypothetical protein
MKSSLVLAGMTQKIVKSLPVWGTILIIVLGIASSIPALLDVTPGWLSQLSLSTSRFSAVFLGIFIEAVPFLLMGTIASGIAEEFISPNGLSRWFPKNRFIAAILGSLVGVFFPVCECGVIPFVRRLLRKGVPLSAGMAALLAVPVVNPIVLASTYAAFGLGLIFWGRISLSIFIAVATGVILSFYPSINSDRDLPFHQNFTQHPVNHSEKEENVSTRLRRVAVIAVNEFFEMGRFLVFGAILVALLQTFFSQASLVGIAKGPLLSVLSLQVLAFLLSVCSTVDAFIALSFTGTFTSGSILGFLVFGPMVDIKSLLMYTQVFKPGLVIVLVLLTLVMTLVLGSAVNYLIM